MKTLNTLLGFVLVITVTIVVVVAGIILNVVETKIASIALAVHCII